MWNCASENRRRQHLIGGIEVPCCRHRSRGAGFDHYPNLRGAAVPTKRCAVFNRSAALGTGMLHGSQGIAGKRKEATGGGRAGECADPRNQIVSLSPPRVCTNTIAKSVPFPFSCGEIETMCWFCLVPTLSSSVLPVEFSQLSWLDPLSPSLPMWTPTSPASP